MSNVKNYQIISYLHQQDISQAILTILEEQRITDKDLETMDRDDIEHLFKNSYGFTFHDRKQLWNVLQKIRSTDTKNNDIYFQQEDETPDIYEIISDEPPNYPLSRHYIPIASSNVPTSEGIYGHSYHNVVGNMLDVNNSEEKNDVESINATTSLPAAVTQSVPRRGKKGSSDIRFVYPVELPVFSSKVLRAFETNNIESEWTTLIDELANWTVSKKETPMTQCEYQSIGRTVYKYYPSISRDGFRPWSCLCKCLTQKVRKLKHKRIEKVKL